MALIELTEVDKIYNSGKLAVHALKSVSMTIESGEFVCVAGPSGSGKSTLLNLIGVLDFPTKGTVVVNGRRTSGLSLTAAALMRRDCIGFVFQAFNLIEVLSAWENVEYGLILQGKSVKDQQEMIADALNAVGLGKYMHQQVTALSGGEQQRVAIARAIAGNPQVVLADEPTANLDTATGMAIIELFRKMNKERGTTFVFSSHDTRITGLADRTMTLVDGRLVNPNHS